MVHSNAIRFVSPTPLNFDALPHSLSPFIPTSVSAKQLNYGQGEGQIQVEDCVWGIYVDFDREHAYKIQFEEGTLSLPQFIRHIELIKDAAESFFKVSFKVEIIGCWVEE
ncbi:hypothetical protein N8590_02255 [bacterium]|jgi:hypothetical protein|nr:hypothetical protein [bacterium]